VTGFLKPLPDATPVDDAGARDAAYARGRVTTLVGITAVYSFYYVVRAVLDVAKKPLISAGVFDADQLGTIGAMMTGAYAVGKLVNGWIADRVNVARFLPLGLFLSAMVNLAMGANTAFGVAAVLWMLNGYVQGVGASTSVRGLTQWFAGSERGRVYGIWSGAHSAGEFLTLIGTASLIAHAGWRAGFFGPGIACAGVALIAALVLKDRPQAYGLPDVHDWKDEPHDDAPSTRTAQLEVLRHPAIWTCAIASALLFVTRFGIKSWGVYYLQETHGFSLVGASFLVGLNAVSGLLGAFAYGCVSDVWFRGRRPPATLLFGVLEVAALLALFYGPPSIPLLVAALFVYGFALSGILAVLGGLFAVDLSSKRAAGLAMGFIGFVSYVGATIQEKVAGALIRANTVTLPDGSTRVDFTQPIAIWVGASIASLLVAATLWRVRRRS
jgi:OPA family sugar phosphate sensor protein UhpC-like MFS transporter